MKLRKTAHRTYGDIPASNVQDDLSGGSSLFPSNRSIGQMLAESNTLSFVPARKQAIMPDFHKSRWKNMHEETADRLVSRQIHDFPLAVVFVIPPFEGDLTIINFKDAVVGNSNAVGVPAKILHYARGGFKGRFAVNDPFFLVTSIQQPLKIT